MFLYVNAFSMSIGYMANVNRIGGLVCQERASKRASTAVNDDKLSIFIFTLSLFEDN